MAELITTDEELPFVHVYQPSLLTRSTEVTGEPPVDPPRREPVESFRDELPEGVVDLGGALDDVEEPVFYDETHTTEAGSRFIAAALLDELWPTLEAVADEQEVGRCP